MKQRYLSITVFVMVIIVLMSYTDKSNLRYYYSFNKKIFIEELEHKVIVKYKTNQRFKNKQLAVELELSDNQLEWEDDRTCIITIENSLQKKVKDKISKQEDVESFNPVYVDNSGREFRFTDEFIVYYKENATHKEINKLHKKHEIEVVKTSYTYVLLRVPERIDVLEIANIYYESGLTLYSHPNFILKGELYSEIPNDTYFEKQFYLNNTGQVFTDGHYGTDDADIDAPEAWSLTKGNNDIIIAVLDDGLTPNHPDLPESRQFIVDSCNFEFPTNVDNNPEPKGNDYHGTACAGIIAATNNNNLGISGVAPYCKIMPMRIKDSHYYTQVADAISIAWRRGADVISYSGGLPYTDPMEVEAIHLAILNATTKGRNGKGCVIAISASNSAIHSIGNRGEVRFPSNVEIDGVLTVGASDRYDKQANYSPSGNPTLPHNQIIDIVAPSNRAYSHRIAGETREVWSIDIPGEPGANPVHVSDPGGLPVVGSELPDEDTGPYYLDYTGRFGGTSASCPQVAGVAALILSINSNLTQLQVFDIITSTADQVGGYTYTDGVSNQLGHGRLNAYKAVVKANASISGPSSICASKNAIFTLNNPLAGTNVNWTTSDNLTIFSGNETNVLTVRGTSVYLNEIGFVYATIHFGDDSVSIEKSFSINGNPYISNYQISGGYDNVPFNSSDVFYVNTSPNASSYQWSIINTNDICNPTQLPTFIGPQTGTSVTVNYGTCSDLYRLRCEAINSCGSTYYQDKIINVYDPNGDDNPCVTTMSIFPNPGKKDEFTTLRIDYPDDPCDDYLEAYSQVENEIKIHDMSGNLVHQVTFSSDTYIFKNANFKNGIYIINIKDKKGKLHQKRLTIK